MIASNMFRFVAVRPPELQTAEDTSNVRNDAEAAVVTALEQELPNHHGDLDKARRKLGSDMIKDPAFYAVEPTWKKLRLLTMDVVTLLQATAKNPVRNTFITAATALLDPVLGPNLDLTVFAASNQFKQLLAVLFKSYYAVVLNPDERAQERQEMAVWIALFALLATLADDTKFRATAKLAPDMRPAVPIAFYRLKPGQQQPPVGGGVQPQPPQPAPKPDDVHIREIEKELGVLTKAQKFLGELYASKVEGFKNLTIQAKIPPVKQGKKGKPTLVKAGVDLSKQAPWQLSAADLQGTRPHAPALELAGLDARTSNIPQLLEGIDKKIAALNGELADVKTKPTVVLSGLIPVQLRR